MSWTPAQVDRIAAITLRIQRLDLEILAASEGMDYEHVEICERERDELLNERLTIRRDMGEIEK